MEPAAPAEVRGCVNMPRRGSQSLIEPSVSLCESMTRVSLFAFSPWMLDMVLSERTRQGGVPRYFRAFAEMRSKTSSRGVMTKGRMRGRGRNGGVEATKSSPSDDGNRQGMRLRKARGNQARGRARNRPRRRRSTTFAGVDSDPRFRSRQTLVSCARAGGRCLSDSVRQLP